VKIITCAFLVIHCFIGQIAFAQVEHGNIKIHTSYTTDSDQDVYIPPVYKVREGDTLWDVCNHYFSNPWHWPDVWALNPQITNPNWIYPGDVITLMPAKKEMIVEKQEAYQSPQEFRRKFTQESINKQFYVKNVALISDKEYKEAGFIHASREEKKNLSSFDEVYLEFETLSEVTTGQNYSIFREVKPIVESEKNYGYRVDFIGHARIISIHDHYAKAVITDTLEEIMRGDKVIPEVWKDRNVKPTKNTVDLNAIVIDIYRPPVSIGQNVLVFINRGHEDKVQIGNRFHVLLRGDGYEELSDDEVSKLPDEVIGEIMVVDARPKTSLAYVVQSHKEFYVGARLVMRAGY